MDNLIQGYFYLEKENNDDIETIKFEIMSLFELWLGDMLEANDLPNNYRSEELIFIDFNQVPVSPFAQNIHSIFIKTDR